MELRTAGEISEPERLVPDVVIGVHEAGNPYFDYLWGAPEAARAALTRWARRESSEVWVGRSVVLQDGEVVVGGFIAIPGAELERCRKADMMALLLESGREGRAELRRKLERTSGLFAKVEGDSFYLSKMWVREDARGAGRGSVLMRGYLEAGHRMGLSDFCLEVSHENQPAIRLYRSFGFEISDKKSSSDARLCYLRMAASLPCSS